MSAYLARYAPIVKAARLKPPDARLTVVERLPGSASTEFGVPGAISPRDSTIDSKRIPKLMRAAWTAFDAVVANSPAELRKGPRGGGRDRDKMVEHVYGAESAYARQLGLRLSQPALGDAEAIKALRAALLERLTHPAEDARWPPAYAARRIAWHVLDHAWEMEDRRV